MFKPLSALAAVALASALVVPTVSQAADATAVRVTYADLNLATDAGQYKLRHRIGYAADRVCEVGERSLDLKRAVAARSCRTTAVADAEPAYLAAIGLARRGTVTVLDGAALIITAR